MSSPSQHESVDKLRERILFLLDGTFGGYPFPSVHWRPKSPIFSGFRAGIIYAILFCALPRIKWEHSILFWLSVWGSCYLAFGTAIARSTSSSIFEIIEDSVLPVLSETAAAAIDKDLARRFDSTRVSALSFLVAMVAAGVSAIAIHYDVKSLSFLEIGWCCFGLFILYTTSARTAYVARFYGTFAAHLKIDADRVYALDPAHSLPVAGIASVGPRVLLFWFGIVCSILILAPLFSDNLSWFVWFVVALGGLLSFGFGTIVFLTSEHDIRRVVNGVAASTLRAAEAEIADLFNRRSSLDDPQWKRLQELTALHEKMVATGSYRSTLLSGLSILVPFVGPVAAAVPWPKLIQSLTGPAPP